MRSNNKKLFRFLSILISFLIFFLACNQQEKSDRYTADYDNYMGWSIKMADSEMARRGNSLMYGGSDPDAKWRYTTGLFLKSLFELWQETEDSRYLEYVRNVIDSFIEENGEIKTYKMTDFNLDKINSGKILLELYQISNDIKYKRSAEILREQLRKQPRTSEGGFWHKKRYPSQMWLDGIYMSSPFYARFGVMFGEREVFDDVLKQIKLIDVHTRDSETGLRYHAWDESGEQVWADPLTGCSPHFWGRAMGWYSMALVDVLDYIPAEYESRSQILYILNDLLKAIAKYQDASGLWYQIVNLGERSGNYLESSCSAMFVYSLAKAINKGYIDQLYRDIAVKGYTGLLNEMISIDNDDKISLHNICSVAGLGGHPYRDGSFEYYISEPVVSNDLKGIGPFIMAGIQMEKVMSVALSQF